MSLVKLRDHDDSRFLTVNLAHVEIVEPLFGGRSGKKVVGSKLHLCSGTLVTVKASPQKIRSLSQGSVYDVSE